MFLLQAGDDSGNRGAGAVEQGGSGAWNAQARPRVETADHW